MAASDCVYSRAMSLRIPLKMSLGLLGLTALTGCPGQRATTATTQPAQSVPDSAAPKSATPVVETTPPGDTPAEAGATLVLRGTPEIPEELRVRLARYLDTRSAGLSSLADDGKTILISTRFGETSQIHRVASPGAARTQLTFGLEPARGGSFVPGNSQALLFTQDAGGDEQFQIFRLDLDSGETVRVTDGKGRVIASAFSRDGKRLAYASNSRNGVDFDIWVSDGKSADSAQLVVEGKGYWYPVEFSSDNQRLVIGEYVSANLSRLYIADVKTGKVEPLSPPDTQAAYSGGLLSRNGKLAYVTSDHEGEFRQLYEVDLAKKTWRSLTSDIPWDVGDMALSADGRTLAFVINEGGYGRIRFLDTRTRKHRVVPGMPEGVIGGVTFARKAPVLGFTLSSDKTTGDAYTYDLRRRKAVRWTESEMGGLDPDTFVEPELIEFTSFDKAKIPAFYYKPKGDGPFPVVVSIHGGPEAQARPGFSALWQFVLVELGYAVILPNVRGSAGYGKTYLTLDNGFKREDSVKDIGALLDWIASRKELDQNKVAVVGGSYGGYMVLASLVHFGDRIKAGIDIVGISSFVTFLENTADYRRDLRRVEYGDERDPAMRKHLEAISPLNHVSKIKSALFVAQGANDPRVPASEAEQIVEAVSRSGHDVWYMLARDEGHGFAKKDNRDTFTLLAILFLQKHLGQK